MSIKKIIGLLCFIVATLPSLGQEDSIRTKDLNEVVIVGSRIEQDLVQVNRSIEVIGRKSIEESPYQNVSDLLAQQTGIYIIGQNQTPGSNQSLFLRGTNSNSVNILIDGVRLMDSSTPNGAIDLSELSLVNVERIEILKGSQGVLYGSMGLGGVINIVTRKPDKGLSGNVSGQYGTFGKNTSSLRQSVRLNYQLENGIYIDGGAQLDQVKGLDATLEDPMNPKLTNDSDDFIKNDWVLRAGYAGEKLDLSVSYKNISQEADLDDGAFVDDENHHLVLNRDFLNYQGSLKFYSSNLKLLGGWSLIDREVEDDSSFMRPTGALGQSYSFNSLKGENFTNELQWSKEAKQYSVVMGAGSFTESMDLYSYFFSNEFGDFETESSYDSLDLKTTSNYLFGQFSYYDLGLKGTIITGGVRYSRHSNYGNQLSYEFSPGLTFEKGKVFAVFSTGFKNPSLTQLFDPNTGPFTSRGNENLQPETSVSFELGSQVRIRGLKMDFSVFKIRVNDFIEYVYLWDSEVVALESLSFVDYQGDTYLNIGNQTNRGIETSLDFSYNSWTFNASYSYVDAKIKYDPENIDTDKTGGKLVQLYSNGAFLEGGETIDGSLVRRPSHMLISSVEYQIIDPLKVYVSYRYVDGRNDIFYDPTLGPFGALNNLGISRYNLWNMGVQGNFSRFNYGARIENLMDTNYTEIQGYTTRGRSVYVRVGFQF